METCNKLMFLTYATFSIIHLVKSQNQLGFISLDCGLPSNESPYNEANSNLTYISDANFIQGGKTGNVQKDLVMKLRKPYTVLRYFPDGIRNCYSLNVTQDTNYLIRAMFQYGNYDGLNMSPRFDLYLGPNIWTTIDMGKSGDGVLEEIIHITRSNILEICLVKTGTSTPIISSIELRPLRYDTYKARTGSLRNFDRLYFTNSNNFIRYPQDVHDRIWVPYMLPEWTHTNTTLNVIDSSDGYDPPQDVLRTGAVPANASDPMTITWTLYTATDQVYGYIYSAEITEVLANETREFEVVVNSDKVHFDPFRPTKFEAQILFNDVPLTCEGGFCRVQLIKTPRSTLPPLMNAFEIFTVIEFPQSETNQNDVIALKKIQATYGLNRISWQGDPCVPKQFSWTGLSCNVIDVSTPPRIVKLDLSSSGLNGVISPSIQNLTQLQELDLSQNNLTGEVPEFLAKMKSLLVINLSGNKLSGLVPQALLDKKKEGLKLLVDENMICVSCRTRFPTAAVAVSVSLVAIIILVLVLIFVLRRRKPSAGKVRRSSFKSKNRRFTYSDVKEMTNNFQVVLGKGGFGVVYQGYLNNEQAAVKVLSHSSAQGYKEFKTEVELLLRVHHEKLVSLIGYCDDENGLALIYELMGKGNLKEHLSGKPGGSVLSWPIRLKIALESAIGIEYLHTGCKPKIVHRDVKSTNILLSEEFDAKIADFGLSRSFIIGNEAEPTVVAGTFGYLDPEYHKTSLLSTKSDVYSFGVVLLEIITGQPVIDLSRENCNIVEWTRSILENGDIESIVDPNLHQDYDTSSAWKVLELAMSCVNLSSKERPNMSQVVHELNECLDTCEKWRNQRSQQEVDLRSPLELSITVDTEINPKSIKKIQATYGLNRISWQGDPCVPKQFSWTGLSCNVIDVSTPPRIVKLDLSSSGLNGVISPSIQNLTQLQELDLSQNNLTGEVPEFLAKMKSLLVINLSGNKLSGLVPQALLDKKKEGLKLLVDENMICVSCRTRFPTAAVAVSVSLVAIIILVLVLIFVLRRRKPSAGKVRRSSFKSKNRRFTYSDVKEMTNNFQVVLGKGGFGVVYQGYLNNEQAAVKVLSHSSAQGYKEFKTEVELLLRVHHEKLVSLIGYCDDENGLALIYELMGKGNLKEHLSGKPGGSVLSWPIRLKIALESAIGIEYLHTGCKPKIVHRDVKSTNILLSEEFDAKIADFGLSRSFIIGNEAEPTVVAGTFGYLDPEYHKTSLLSTKSDVYSFGVVLLEIITGQPVIDLSRENCNIVEWTRSILENGDIESIVDPNLHQDYDTSSAWKVLELAMSCVNLSSKERPNMSQVVHELNECLDTCEKWRNQRSQQEVDLRSPLELSITVDTEINPKAR